LLADRRAAGDRLSALPVLVERDLDAVPVEPLVFDELRILGGNQRAM
jgi:hypothetical protein